MLNTSLKNKLTGTLLLLLASIIWGFAFVAQSVGMDYIEPFTFSAIRSFIGALVLLPFIFMSGRKNKKSIAKTVDRKAIFSGLICGIILFAATNLQQAGLQYTTAGKAGFITSFYIVLVPVAGIFLKKRTGLVTWISVGIALIGLYLICFNAAAGLSLGRGDLLVLLCAFAFTGHILVIDRFAGEVNGLVLSCLQFLVSGMLSAITALIFEQPEITAVYAAWLPLIYTGVLSSAVAYTFQIIGQAKLRPTVASLLMSLESVFSVLAMWLVLRQTLSARELAGCGLMFIAIILVQTVPAKIKIQKETAVYNAAEKLIMKVGDEE
jgi:drug/metabolite transporter (DMT)-like permease